jgi:predicted DNA-binding transcriptional regulator AlpA
MTMKKLPQTGNAGVLRKLAAMDYVGLGATVFDELVVLGVDAGGLPSPIKIHDAGRSVGWVRTELDAWLVERIAARDAKRDKTTKPKTGGMR